MLKKIIKFTDYNGVDREYEAYFNINKAELTELEMSMKGGFAEAVRMAMNDNDTPTIMEIFKKLITMSYGKKSADGIRFDKSPEILREFMATEAYSNLYMEIITDDEKAADFVNGILPKIDGKTATELAKENPDFKKRMIVDKNIDNN